ncbi:hypothetical protein DL96DRAFT_1589798 [Flagelloscypha sp. PMI_526]|nr:hypothetical protein DL96DRAFT_1589798 [Flagelloscypha sp. PMI_526]
MMDPDTYAAISKAPPLTLSSEPLLPPAPPPASRSADNMMPGQWKQEFYKLREKLDHVSRANQEAKHTLDIANAKMKELEDENNLLLDALFIASQPIPKPGAPRPKTQTDQMHYSPQHVRERYGHRQPPPPTHQQHQQQSQYSQYNSKYHSAHNQLPPPVPHSPYHHPEHEDPTTHQPSTSSVEGRKT